MNSPEEKVRSTLLVESSQDDVGLWLVVRWVRERLGLGEEPVALREETLGLLGKMLRDGVIQAGRPAPQRQGFAPWPLSAEEAVARIRSEWTALGRAPRLGEIVWFAATEQGERRARRHATVTRQRGTLNIGDPSGVE